MNEEYGIKFIVDFLQREKESLQRDKKGLQRDKEALQRDKEALQRDKNTFLSLIANLQRDKDEANKKYLFLKQKFRIFKYMAASCHRRTLWIEGQLTIELRSIPRNTRISPRLIIFIPHVDRNTGFT